MPKGGSQKCVGGPNQEPGDVLLCTALFRLGRWHERKKTNVKNVQRVTRLLYQVDHRLKDLTRLWHEEDVNAIRKRFFEGNRRLNKTRVPSTLKAHIHAWKLVLHFSGNPGMDISAHVVLTNRT